MPTTSDPPAVEELADAVRELSKTVAQLMQYVDEIGDELHYHNHRAARAGPPRPFQLKSMSLDPTDFRVNHFEPGTGYEQPERTSITHVDAIPDPLQERLDRIEQVLAALILLTFSGIPEEEMNAADIIHVWATQTYEMKALAKCFGDDVEAYIDRSPRDPQKQLFDDADEADG